MVGLVATTCLPATVTGTLGECGSSPLAAPRDRIRAIKRSTIFRGTLDAAGKPLGTTWFSTRCCLIPPPANAERTTPTALMLLCEITGSDYFGPTHVTESTDSGQTWNVPTPVPGLGRTPLGDSAGTEVTVCDMVPEFHRQTGTVLAMGHDVFYRDGHFFRDQPPRHAVYLVRAADGTWGPLQRLEWNDPRGAFIYTCNCAQRTTLTGGDILVPLSVGATSAARSVVVVRCAFDGRELRVRSTSNELTNTKGRGLLEPSLAQLDGRHYLTIRAEDERGYVSTSDDEGSTWTPQIAWAFDDGEPLVTSTTQQRWLTLDGELYLVYVRKDPTNLSVMRWRAPLFIALVDRRTLRLVRNTERIVVPLEGDGVGAGDRVPHLGNFHCCVAGPREAWVTVGDYDPKAFRGNTTLARVLAS
ncbi:MAG: exo-alpha-sialidase [Pirellula sp.]|nr:exo-alpha-sialidase [Pirellula sp.]